MSGGTCKCCYICKHTKARDPGVCMHRFPASSERRQQWCQILQIQEKDLPKDARICSTCCRHFVDGDTSNLPSLSIGKRFASPKKWPLLIRVPVPPRKQQKLMKQTLVENPSPSLSVSSSKSASCASCDPGSNSPPPSSFDFGKERREDLEITVK